MAQVRPGDLVGQFDGDADFALLLVEVDAAGPVVVSAAAAWPREEHAPRQMRMFPSGRYACRW